MADEIMNCRTIKEGATIKTHQVFYKLDGGQKILISIDASELADPTDMAELKTVANIKATEVKTNLETVLTTTNDSSINGNVTLGE